MFSRKFIKIWLILLTIAAVALLIGSCSSNTKPDPKEPPVNKAPKIEIVNIPPNNSHFTTNPQVYWFGTDVDGKIVTYEYAVVPAALLVAAHVDTTNDSLIRAYAFDHLSEPAADRDCKPESCWQQIDVATADNPNEQTIRLYANKDPNINTLQYFFVRAVDNDSARSNIDYRLYSRTNHPPDTQIKTIPDSTGYYDLPDTSATYKGIYFEWKGTDKIDYPNDNDNPTFEYFYQVFGPYQKSEIYGANGVFDYTKVDTGTTEHPSSKLVQTSHDSISTANVWVNNVSTKIYGLWKDQPPSDTTRSGYFVLKVTARDDAFVSDTLPAFVPFLTIDAHFEKDLLVYVQFFCVNSDQLGEIHCGDTMDSIFAFYKRVVSAAGYGSSRIIMSPGRRDTSASVTKLELAKYKVFLMIDDGAKTHLKDQNNPGRRYNELLPYMDLGGNVWVWALNPFGAYYNATAAALNSLAQITVPNMYFDVVGEFYGGWPDSYRLSWGGKGRHPDVFLPTNEEFLGGLSLAGTGMPNFAVDSMKYASTYLTLPTYRTPFRAAPHTNYFQRYAFSEPLWLFHSYFGDFVPDSMKAYVAGLNGRVIGLRYDSGIFKTAVYGFSMYMLPEEQAADIFRLSMAWFLSKQ